MSSAAMNFDEKDILDPEDFMNRVAVPNFPVSLFTDMLAPFDDQYSFVADEFPNPSIPETLALYDSARIWEIPDEEPSRYQSSINRANKKAVRRPRQPKSSLR